MTSSRITALLFAMSVAFSPLGAQQRGSRNVPRPRLRPQIERQDQLRPNGKRSPAERAQLEQRFHERVAQVVRERLHLTDEQMIRLQEADARAAARRRPLLQQERDVRLQLRDELAKGSGADQGRVGTLMDQALLLQRQREALLDDEQRELADFLTPVQRAQYIGLQNQVRKRLREMQDQNSPELSGTP